jgi:hypothetical protein
MVKQWKKQIIVKHNFIKKDEHGVTSYVDKNHEELAQVRTRMQEIYQITLPLRKEIYNLRKRHEELVALVSGVKIL